MPVSETTSLALSLSDYLLTKATIEVIWDFKNTAANLTSHIHKFRIGALSPAVRCRFDPLLEMQFRFSLTTIMMHHKMLKNLMRLACRELFDEASHGYLSLL